MFVSLREETNRAMALMYSNLIWTVLFLPVKIIALEIIADNCKAYLPGVHVQPERNLA